MSETQNLTLGQRRVGINYLPRTSKTVVDEIKEKSAELIDLFQMLKPAGSKASEVHGEAIRALSLAQTHVETASMFAVKSQFIK